MFFIRTASESDLPRVQEILIETWHATYDEIYGVEKVNEITGKWHSLERLS
ncbi:MAG: GNAT family N-acetyltransferase, partial [Pseudomonadota bacterium]